MLLKDWHKEEPGVMKLALKEGTFGSGFGGMVAPLQ